MIACGFLMMVAGRASSVLLPEIVISFAEDVLATALAKVNDLPQAMQNFLPIVVVALPQCGQMTGVISG